MMGTSSSQLIWTVNIFCYVGRGDETEKVTDTMWQFLNREDAILAAVGWIQSLLHNDHPRLYCHLHPAGGYEELIQWKLNRSDYIEVVPERLYTRLGQHLGQC